MKLNRLLLILTLFIFSCNEEKEDIFPSILGKWEFESVFVQDKVDSYLYLGDCLYIDAPEKFYYSINKYNIEFISEEKVKIYFPCDDFYVTLYWNRKQNKATLISGPSITPFTIISVNNNTLKIRMDSFAYSPIYTFKK